LVGIVLLEAFDLAKAKANGVTMSSGRCLQRVIPVTVIDVDGTDLDAMITGINDEPRWRVEPHRLAVQNGAGEHRRVMAFQPAAGVGKQREAGGVRLWKPIFTEAFDLTENTFGELGVVTAFQHALYKLVPKRADAPGFLKCRHGT